jgi:hypothetical protein
MSRCVSRCRRGESALTLVLPADKATALSYAFESKMSV